MAVWLFPDDSWCKALPGRKNHNNRRGGCTLLTANHSPDGLTIPQTSQCRSVALSHCAQDLALSENVGYIPNEIAIFHRDNDH